MSRLSSPLSVAVVFGVLAMFTVIAGVQRRQPAQARAARHEDI